MSGALIARNALRRTQRQLTEVRLRQVDELLLLAGLALAALGLVMVASASMPLAEGDFGDRLHYVKRQAIFLAVGLTAGWIAWRLPLILWDRLGLALLAGAIVLLVAVLIPGVGLTVNGATRWIDLGPVNLQVSEPAKLLLILYLAGYLARRQAVMMTWVGFLRPVVILGIAAALLILEPDFGGAVVLFATGLGMLFLGGVRLGQMIVLGTLAGAIFAALLVTSPYRLERLITFLDPWADPQGSGYQLTQALIAIGQGGFSGVGLGNSMQKLLYLPEAHTDFIFAVLAEELGFIGVTAVIGLFALIIVRAFRIGALANRAGQPFHAAIAFGIGIWVGLQTLINLGVNMGLLPTKGLTLPFLSYGGSSLVVMCAALGLLLRVHWETFTPRHQARRGERALNQAEARVDDGPQ